MPPKKRDLAAEKAAKQKKVLYILIPAFLAVMWFMLIPTLTKKSPGPPAASGATPSGTASTPAVTTAGAVSPPATDVSSVSPGAIAAPSYSFTAGDGQLKRFSGSLKTKDPFAGTPAVTNAQSTTPIVAPTPPV